MKQLLVHEELDKCRRQQRKEGLSLEESPSTSLSMEASDGDDRGEVGRGPLDHLPNIVEVVPGALASSPALPGGGGEVDPGLAVAGSGAEANTPETRVLGKRAISPLGSVAVVEQAVVEATPPPLQRTEEAPGSIEDRPAPMDMEATPLPPPPPLQTRFAMAKRLPPQSSPDSSAHWVAEAQAAIQHGAASARVDPKGPATQGGVAEAAPTQTREGALPPHGGEAHESDGADVPLIAEAPGVSEAEAMEATAPTTAETAVAAVGVSASAEATMAEAEAPETVEAVIAEAGAPEVTKAVVMAVRPSVQEAEM
ncbi:uncharacterized protein [Miscanthus floridulus]|uniref:uncharacterized protein n=1 Tax=Miscanthus floridulus TaxID=154761 RepID=UPI003458068A